MSSKQRRKKRSKRKQRPMGRNGIKDRGTKDRRTKDDPPTSISDTGEERFADCLTIIWMLSAVATLGALVVAGLARALVIFSVQETATNIARIIPRHFLVCSVLIGIVCLILTPMAWYVRRTKPPLSIMVTAVAIAVAPLIVAIAVQVIR